MKPVSVRRRPAKETRAKPAAVHSHASWNWVGKPTVRSPEIRYGGRLPGRKQRRIVSVRVLVHVIGEDGTAEISRWSRSPCAFKDQNAHASNPGDGTAQRRVTRRNTPDEAGRRGAARTGGRLPGSRRDRSFHESALRPPGRPRRRDAPASGRPRQPAEHRSRAEGSRSRAWSPRPHRRRNRSADPSVATTSPGTIVVMSAARIEPHGRTENEVPPGSSDVRALRRVEHPRRSRRRESRTVRHVGHEAESEPVERLVDALQVPVSGHEATTSHRPRSSRRASRRPRELLEGTAAESAPESRQRKLDENRLVSVSERRTSFGDEAAPAPGGPL